MLTHKLPLSGVVAPEGLPVIPTTAEQVREQDQALRQHLIAAGIITPASEGAGFTMSATMRDHLASLPCLTIRK